MSKGKIIASNINHGRLSIILFYFLLLLPGQELFCQESTVHFTPNYVSLKDKNNRLVSYSTKSQRPALYSQLISNPNSSMLAYNWRIKRSLSKVLLVSAGASFLLASYNTFITNGNRNLKTGLWLTAVGTTFGQYYLKKSSIKDLHTAVEYYNETILDDNLSFQLQIGPQGIGLCLAF